MLGDERMLDVLRARKCSRVTLAEATSSIFAGIYFRYGLSRMYEAIQIFKLSFVRQIFFVTCAFQKKETSPLSETNRSGSLMRVLKKVLKIKKKKKKENTKAKSRVALRRNEKYFFFLLLYFSSPPDPIRYVYEREEKGKKEKKKKG